MIYEEPTYPQESIEQQAALYLFAYQLKEQQ